MASRRWRHATTSSPRRPPAPVASSSVPDRSASTSAPSPTGGRRSATDSTSRGSGGCSPSRCATPCATRARPDRPQPWWAPPDRLTPRQARLMGLLAAASLSAAFANTLFTQTVNFAADSFGIDKTGQGVGGVVVRLGVVITLPFAIAADRVGRRRMIVLAAWLAPLFCVLGALAPSFWTLVATQSIARPLGLALALVVGVAAAEEMPRNCRAYALSVLAMASGLGAGVAVIALRLADVGSEGWRLIYLLSAIWFIAAWDLQRGLPETPPLRGPPGDRGADRGGRGPPPAPRSAGAGVPRRRVRQPVRRPGLVLPEPLPRRRPRLLRRRHRPVRHLHRDAGRHRADRRRPAGRRDRPAGRAPAVHAAVDGVPRRRLRRRWAADVVRRVPRRRDRRTRLPGVHRVPRRAVQHGQPRPGERLDHRRVARRQQCRLDRRRRPARPRLELRDGDGADGHRPARRRDHRLLRLPGDRPPVAGAAQPGGHRRPRRPRASSGPGPTVTTP